MSSSRATLQLKPAPPFDFAKSLRFVERFSPSAGEQRIDEYMLCKAFNIAGVPVVAKIRAHGSAEAPSLAVELFAKRPLSDKKIEATRERITRYLSLDVDLLPFYDLARRDPVMAPLIERGYGFHQVRFPTPFENAVWAVLGQRAPAKIARSAKDRVTAHFGVALELDGTTYRAFPEARVLAVVSKDALADAVRNVRKLPYVRAVALAFADVDEAWLREGPYDDVRSWLRAIDGIGDWSAAFV